MMLTIIRYSTTPGGGGSDGHITPPGPGLISPSPSAPVWALTLAPHLLHGRQRTDTARSAASTTA